MTTQQDIWAQQREIWNERLERERKELDEALSSGRYTLTRLAGRGCWGDVYKARDNILKSDCAIKVLNPKDEGAVMLARNLTPLKAMIKESGMYPCAYIVPRSLEFDDNGKPFIVMPFYKRFLCDNPVTTTRQNLEQLLDVAKGLAEMHTIRKRAHGDLKPDNIAIDENGRCLINDLGTSTFASYGQSESPRDNMGCINYRAPELFREGSHPNSQSDNYSWAVLSYKMFAGEHMFVPFDSLIDTGSFTSKFYINEKPFVHVSEIKNPEEFDNAAKQLVTKNIPKEMQQIILRNLSYEPWKRNYNGESLAQDLEKILDGHGKLEEFKDYSRRFGLPLGLPALGISALLALAIYGIATHEPQIDNKPPVRIHGPLNPGQNPGKCLNFQTEEITELPQAYDGLLYSGYGNVARRITDNRDIAYLLKTHSYASTRLGGFASVSEYQGQIYSEVKEELEQDESKKFGPTWYTWKKAIEIAIEENKQPDGKIDLEDLMVSARLGPGKVKELKAQAGSANYIDYREYLPKNERIFIDQWLSYFHNDID